MLGSIGGLSPICTSGESGAGIREGARTGIGAIVIGLCFLASVFFAPLFASIPPYATGPALVVVGALMMSTAAEIDWDNPMKAIPAFITIAFMPLTYSIAYGVIAGLMVYVALRAMRKALNLFFIYVLRKKDSRIGYKTKVPAELAGNDDGGDDDEEDDDDFGPGGRGFSYTGDYVSQAAIKRANQKSATSAAGTVEMARGRPLADQDLDEDDEDLEKM